MPMLLRLIIPTPLNTVLHLCHDGSSLMGQQFDCTHIDMLVSDLPV